MHMIYWEVYTTSVKNSYLWETSLRMILIFFQVVHIFCIVSKYSVFGSYYFYIKGNVVKGEVTFS